MTLQGEFEQIQRLNKDLKNKTEELTTNQKTQLLMEEAMATTLRNLNLKEREIEKLQAVHNESERGLDAMLEELRKREIGTQEREAMNATFGHREKKLMQRIQQQEEREKHFFEHDASLLQRNFKKRKALLESYRSN